MVFLSRGIGETVRLRDIQLDTRVHQGEIAILVRLFQQSILRSSRQTTDDLRCRERAIRTEFSADFPADPFLELQWP